MTQKILKERRTGFSFAGLGIMFIAIGAANPEYRLSILAGAVLLIAAFLVRK